MKNHLSLLAILLLVGVTSALCSATAKNQPPFWEKSPDVEKKILKERKIPVSVEVTAGANDSQQHMDMEGAGLINAPEPFASPWILKFENLKRVSSYVKEVKWNEEEKLLYLHTAALGYHARMHVHMVPKIEKGKMVVDWEVKKGFLKGLAGVLVSEEKGFGKTMFSVRASDDFEKTNIPKIFVEFGFEVVVQKFSESLRSLIEEDFKKGRK